MAARSISDVIARRRPAIGLGAAAAVLFAASLALLWPGYATYDTVAQYGQVVSGAYDDWHPPAMVWLWHLLAPLGRGTAPMLVLQLATWWLGLGLIAAALGGRGGVAVLLVGALPSFLGWQGVVLKDAQMAGALVGATGLVLWWRWRGRPMPVAAITAAAVLIAYATLIRANAVFASVPLAVMLVRRPAAPLARAGVIAAGVVAVLATAPVVNHGLLGASRSGVERTQAIYDLAGIAVRVPDPAGTGLDARARAALIARGCVRPYFWDPLGEPSHCNAVVDPLRAIPPGRLYAMLAAAMLHHPVAYARQRLAHLNSTERWWVPAHWPGAVPPVHDEPNDLGLIAPGPAAAVLQRAAGWLVETPLGWPVAWVAAALCALVVALRRTATPRRDLALALLLSALLLEASFAAISIASDLRYHLWSMVATALALTMLCADGAVPRRAWWAGAAVLGIVLAVGIAARATLPLPPQTYTGMLG